jgi:hypothetical protein
VPDVAADAVDAAALAGAAASRGRAAPVAAVAFRNLRRSRVEDIFVRSVEG